jgi:ABC-type amino acid transport substrate-binding protein
MDSWRRALPRRSWRPPPLLLRAPPDEVYGSTDKGENMELMHPTPSLGLYSRCRMTARFGLALLVPFLSLLGAASPASAGTLDRIKDSGKLNIGYGESRPFSYKDESGNPAGFGVALCGKVADALKASLGLPSLTVNYVPTTRDEGLQAVADGKIDLLCDAAVPTVTARKQVSFSIPVYAGGVGAVVRADASTRLKDVLSGRVPPASPAWRGNADVLLRESTLSMIPGTSAARALDARARELQLIPKFAPVNNVATGLTRVLDGRSNAFFAERSVLLDAVKRSPSSGLEVLDRYFTHEKLALAMARDDSDFRLAVDSALSQLYRSDGFRDLYAQTFGPISDIALSFFQIEALPE